MACPVRAPRPETMLTTPAGSTWLRSLPSSKSESGVVEEDLITSVLPAARAGAIFQAPIRSGKFHGMIWPTTPMGSCSTMLIVFSSLMTAEPSSARRQPAK